MGNKSSNAAPLSTAPLTTNTSGTTTETITPTTLSTTPTSTAATATTTTTSAATTTIPTAVTETTPTPTITSTTSVANNTTTTPASIGSTSKSTFYSVVQTATSETNKAKSASSAYAHWYKYSKFEKQKRDKGKIPWYMSSPVTTTDPSTPKTSTLTTTMARMGSDTTEVSDPSNITAIPSFQLRSTAVYSPPHGDRVPSGRNELINTDISVFKYYVPENRSQQTTGIHTKATMYKMNTRSKQTPLPAPLSSVATIDKNAGTNITRDNSSLPAFVSRGLQTDLEPQLMDSSSKQIRYYEKQQPQIVPASALSNYTSGNNGFYHLSSGNTTNQPIEETPVWVNDQPYSSSTQYFPSYPPPPPPTSILKKSSTVLPQDMSNPLSGQTHDRVLEELRKRNKNTKDGVYRIKKVHLLEKNDPVYYPPTVSSNHLPPPPLTKASQSISRSERLLFGRLFNRKK